MLPAYPNELALQTHGAECDPLRITLSFEEGPRLASRAVLGSHGNRLDTALHIAVLHHGFYVGAISIWGA
jgi:hypothetical protein